MPDQWTKAVRVQGASRACLSTVPTRARGRGKMSGAKSQVPNVFIWLSRHACQQPATRSPRLQHPVTPANILPQAGQGCEILLCLPTSCCKLAKAATSCHTCQHLAATPQRLQDPVAPANILLQKLAIKASDQWAASLVSMASADSSEVGIC